MAFDQFALQQAIYQRLTAQITDVPTFSNVPAKQAYPYIRLDMIAADDDGTKTADLWECEVQISAFFDDLSGTGPVSALLKRIAAALIDAQAALAMTGQACVFIRLKMQTILQPGGPDERYVHGVQRFLLLIQEL